MKKLTISLDDADDLGKCDSVKNKSDAICDYIAEGIWIKSKCDWSEHGKKSKKILKKFRKTKRRPKYNKNFLMKR